MDKLESEKLINYKGSKVECNTVYIVEEVVFLSECKVSGKALDDTYGTKAKNMMASAGKYIDLEEAILGEISFTYDFLNTSILNHEISKFIIYTNGTTVPKGYQSKDCSYNQDKSVICYWKEDFEEDNKKYYEMNIAANGEIYTPFDSIELFANLGFYKLENLDLTGVNTKYTINMENMFSETGYNSMTTLNLGDKFDTSNVTHMFGIFQLTGHDSMTSLDLGDTFDTNKVVQMSHIFFLLESFL